LWRGCDFYFFCKKIVFIKDSSAWFIETTFLLHKVFKGIDEEHYYAPITTYTRTRKPDDYSESGEALYTLSEGGFIPGTLPDGEVCIIFGDQRREDGFTGLHDIFTIRYNLSNKWNFVIGQDSIAIVQARNKALFFKKSEDIYDFLRKTDTCKLVDITDTLFRRSQNTSSGEKSNPLINPEVESFTESVAARDGSIFQIAGNNLGNGFKPKTNQPDLWPEYFS
jgi:hypothetical protein